MSTLAFALECEQVPPFNPIGSQVVEVTAFKFDWILGERIETEICRKSLNLSIFDVRGREEEAYRCLRPHPSEVINCETSYLQHTAQIHIVPASWVRKATDGKSFRSYRFHAFIQPVNAPGRYLDIFSRSLTSELSNQSIILEGSKASGEASPDNEGFWIRVQYKVSAFGYSPNQ